MKKTYFSGFFFCVKILRDFHKKKWFSLKKFCKEMTLENSFTIWNIFYPANDTFKSVIAVLENGHFLQGIWQGYRAILVKILQRIGTRRNFICSANQLPICDRFSTTFAATSYNEKLRSVLQLQESTHDATNNVFLSLKFVLENPETKLHKSNFSFAVKK